MGDMDTSKEILSDCTVRLSLRSLGVMTVLDRTG